MQRNSSNNTSACEELRSRLSVEFEQFCVFKLTLFSVYLLRRSATDLKHKFTLWMPSSSNSKMLEKIRRCLADLWVLWWSTIRYFWSKSDVTGSRYHRQWMVFVGIPWISTKMTRCRRMSNRSNRENLTNHARSCMQYCDTLFRLFKYKLHPRARGSSRPLPPSSSPLPPLFSPFTVRSARDEHRLHDRSNDDRV